MLGRAFRLLRDGILSTTYPEQCRICGEPVESYDYGVACANCWTDPSITTLFAGACICNRCGEPVFSKSPTAGSGDSRTDVASRSIRLCGVCHSSPFEFARASGNYTGALEASILFLKSRPHICSLLRKVISDTIRENIDVLCADLIVPVPLHPSRARQRGFNQANLISRIVAACLDRDLDNGCLVRSKQTERHRAGMDVIDRRKSVDGAFEVVGRRMVESCHVLVVDDVLTTGSTVSSVAETLLSAGASSVKVFTIARVPRIKFDSRLLNRPKKAAGKRSRTPVRTRTANKSWF